MKLEKAKEIIELNIREAGNKMPIDTLTALKLHSEAVKDLIEHRKYPNSGVTPLLPGETPDDSPP